MKTVDLFCGAGGLSVGLEQAGHDIICGVDNNVDALETYKYNNPTVGLNIDVSAEDPSDLPVSPNNVELVAGGPPCQGFSIAGDRNESDNRNRLVGKFLDYVSYLNPDTVLMENVTGILSMDLENGQSVVEYIHSRFNKMGYNSAHKTLKANQYSVPQQRERVFFVAKRGGEITFPEPTDDTVTVGDALSTINSTDPNMKLPNHQQKTIDRIANTKQGEALYDSYTQRIRLDDSDLAPTVVSGGERPQWQLGHPTKDRGLTVRERAALQTFPNGYEFKGGVVSGRVQTGNAVPVALARHMGEAIKQ